MNPGQIYEISVDLWATSNVFLSGHSLRLEISSSNFPRFDRNLNTGEEIKFARTLAPATNAILHDATTPFLVDTSGYAVKINSHRYFSRGFNGVGPLILGPLHPLRAAR